MSIYLKQKLKFDHFKTSFDHNLANLARLLLGGYFVYLGTDILYRPSIFSTETVTLNILLLSAIQIILGLCVVFRYHTKYTSLILAFFLLVISLVLYPPLEWTSNNFLKEEFMKNIAIIGGLLFVSASSRGYLQWQDTFFNEEERKLNK